MISALFCFIYIYIYFKGEYLIFLPSVTELGSNQILYCHCHKSNDTDKATPDNQSHPKIKWNMTTHKWINK